MVDRLHARRITASEARELAAAYFQVDPTRIVGGAELAWGGWMVGFAPPMPAGPGPIFVCARTGEVHSTGSVEFARIEHLYEHGPSVPFAKQEQTILRRSWWRRLRDGW